MRNVLTIAMLLVFSSMVWAQPYQSCFGKEKTQWNILIPDRYPVATIIQTVGAKESYNGMEVYRHPNRLNNYYREDTLTGKIWDYNSSIDKEYLIMDLSMEKGDTFFLEPLGGWKEDYVIIDSIYYDEYNRKTLLSDTQFNGDLIPFYMSFTEGIGPNTGVTYWSSGYYAEYLLCLFKNDTLYYHSDLYVEAYGDTCEIYTTDILEISEVSTEIRYFQEKISIELKEPTSGKVELYSLAGKRLKSVEFKNRKTVTLRIGYQKTGVYLVQYVDVGGRCFSEKIIIQ